MPATVRIAFRAALAMLAVGLTAPGTSAGDNSPTASGEAFFRERIEPVLQRECFSCHSKTEGAELEAGLRLDLGNGLKSGGDSGPAIDSEHPEQSLVLQALRHTGGLEMPPDREPLPARVIDDFQKWIAMGAPDPRPGADESDENPQTAAARTHWAFQKIVRPTPPDAPSSLRADSAVDQAADQAIDAFLLAKLAQHDWQFAPLAERAELLRRLTFDLTGLPPTSEALAEFEQDRRPDAYERVVDRLLASPAFGQRWAQHWLDVVRYAESEGYEYDRHLPDAWRYRDYVVDSFNADKPFDRFVAEQIAGDEIDPENHEQLAATIFHRLGPVRRNAGNPEIALSRNEVLTERTDILGTAFLGLSVGCARCHNHKLEPILQKDYYQLQAYLAATAENDVRLASLEEQRAWDAEAERIKEKVKKLRSAAKSATGEAKEQLDEQVEALEKQMPPPLPTIPGIRNDFSDRTPIHVLRRGVWELKGIEVAPRPPSVLVSTTMAALPADCQRPRTELARWLTSDDHPLTARVIVNRIWQHHFGVGIVKTANDFGLHGDPPSHPELLDWLAATLKENQWQLKPLHRKLLLSRAYRQSSQTDSLAAQQENDPENRLLGHFTRRRLTAEEIRDAMLSVSGQLDARVGGASAMVPVDEELVQLLYEPSQWVVSADRAAQSRRTIYLFAKRNLRLPLLESLDAPAMLSSCPRRESSTHAPQALELMNGSTANGLARAFAERLSHDAAGQPEQIVHLAFLRAISREPTSRERELSLQFLEKQPVSEFALALFNLNEFVYVR